MLRIFLICIFRLFRNSGLRKKDYSDGARLPPTSLGTLWRYYLRQEPGALVAHAGIWVGGVGRPAFLPRLFLHNSLVPFFKNCK